MMRRFTGNVLATLAAVACVLAAGRACCAAEGAGEKTAAWAPKFYGFCIDTHDAKHRTLPEQAKLLKDLGFDGSGYGFWLDANLEKNLKTFDDAGLQIYALYASLKVNPGAEPFDRRLPEAIGKLKGRPTVVCVLLQGFPPGDPRGDERAIQSLRELGDAAAKAGVRISIYHHTGDWTQSLQHALDVIKKVNHPQVGVNFNLCHWLMIDGDKDYRPVLRQNANKIFAVTINGAQLGSKTWTNGLIQPLDRGDFDNRELLKTLREVGYRGPIGLMCYGIPGDAGEHLSRSVKLWKSWQTDK